MPQVSLTPFMFWKRSPPKERNGSISESNARGTSRPPSMISSRRVPHHVRRSCSRVRLARRSCTEGERRAGHIVHGSLYEAVPVVTYPRPPVGVRCRVPGTGRILESVRRPSRALGAGGVAAHKLVVGAPAGGGDG